MKLPTYLDELRHELAAMVAGASSESERRELACYILRILDAFEAMEREKWYLTRVTHFEASDETQDYWAVKIAATEVARGPSPIEALLAAAQTLEGKSDIR